MDYGFPPGGLERLFRSYDRIVAHGVPSTGQQEQKPSRDATKDESKEEPPWASPEPTPKKQLLGDVRPEPYLAAEEADAKLIARLGYSPQQSWGDIRAQV